MKILWFSGLPSEVQRERLNSEPHACWSEVAWIMAHLPPPPGVELHIACRSYPHTTYKSFDYKGARFHIVPVKARARPLTLFQLDWLYYRTASEAARPDIIHGWGTEDSCSLAAMKLSPKRHVVGIQGLINTYRRRVPMSWYSYFQAIGERLALARARYVVAENDYSLSSGSEMIGKASTRVIEHPLRPQFLNSEPASGEAEQILFIGNLDDRKGIWDALKAFEKAAPSSWQFAIAGAGTPEAVAKLHSLTATPGLSGRVKYYSIIDADKIINLMQQSSLFLLPSRIDTGPTVLKEAMAMGLWPICYDNSGPGFYIRHFGAGDLAQDLNIDSLTETLANAISQQKWKDPEFREKVTSTIRPRFDKDRIWGELIDLYSRVMSGKPAS
jgi:glycosyltransferase involved in cell wall biosynthesis